MLESVSEEGERYRTNLSAIGPLHPWHAIWERIRPGATVLDVGCGSGELGLWLRDRVALVDGVEKDPQRAALASTRLHHVVRGSAGPSLQADLGLEYDYVLLADVIEHVVEPAPLLRWCVKHLRSGGEVLALIPNMAFWKPRRQQLRGDWRYTTTGYFDRDHVRFYDTRTAALVGAEIGLEVQHVAYTAGVLPRPLHHSVAAARTLAQWRPNLFASHTFVAWTLP